MTEECCTRCGGATGRAGKVEDSLYFDDYGPFCEDCWKDLLCTRCDGEGEIRVLRNARGEVDYLRGSATDERAPCDCCGGKGYIE